MTTDIAKRESNEVASYDPTKHNILTPVVKAMDVPDGARLSVREVRVNPDPQGGDVYKLPGQKLGLTKVALERMAAAAGISVLGVDRIDDRSMAHVYGYRARVRIVDPDGLSREATSTKETDYREGGKDVSGLDARALIQAQKFAAEMTASKALLRALRSCLAIRSSYDAREIARPFIVPKLILDTANDPMAKAAALASMTNAQAQLYPPADRGSVGEDIVAEAKTDEPGPDEPSQKAQAMLDDAWAYSKKSKIGKTEFTRLFNEIGKERAELTVNDMKILTDKLSVRAKELEADADGKADDGMPV